MATASSNDVSYERDEWTKAPFLRRVRIQGYKSIAHCDVRLQPLTILVGRNGAGKSNFLDALAFLRDALDNNVTDAVKRRGDWSTIACRTSNASKIAFDIEIEFLGGWPQQRSNGPDAMAAGVPAGHGAGQSCVARYAVELAESLPTPTIASESLVIQGPGNAWQAGFEARHGTIEQWQTPSESLKPPHSSELFKVYRPDHLLLGVIGAPPFLDLGEGLRNMGFYNFAPVEIRKRQLPNLGWLLEKDGRNLAGVIRRLKEVDPEALSRARDYLTLIVEDIADFDVVRSGQEETIQFAVRSADEARPLLLEARSMSDGTLHALAAIMAGFQIVLPYGHPSVIGIEEPETALHPAALHALVAALDEATQHTQVVLTTHSADLLSDRDIQMSQLLVVRNRGGQTCIAPVDSASTEIVRKELYTLADLQRMDHLDPEDAAWRCQDRAASAEEK